MTRGTASRQTGVAEEILTAAQRGELALPPLPALVSRLLEMIRDEVLADLGEVSHLMLDDTAIATAVLRIANSAAFAGTGSAQDLPGAIQRLGLRQVGTLVTSISHHGHFQSTNPTRLFMLRRLWDHALVSGLAARELAGHSPADRTEAYLAGLLHDTGKLVVLKGVDRLESRSDAPLNSSGDVEELMEALHTGLGFAALRSWKIADRICRVALHHHDPSAGGDRLLMSVQAADVIARRLCSPDTLQGATDLIQAQPLRALGIEEAELAILLATVETEADRARNLLE